MQSVPITTAVQQGHTSPHRALQPSPALRAFTIVEILTSVLIIGVVAALITVGLRIAGVTARGTVDRQTVLSLKTGLTQFQQDFGFAPPLVKDQAQTPERIAETAGIRRIAVYIPSIPADRAALTTPTVAFTAANPFLDNRYSEQSLAYYLAGALDIKRTSAANAPVIDGVPGPGLFRPDTEGYFEIPKDIRDNSTTSKRIGTQHEAFVNLGGKSPSLRDVGRTTAPVDPPGEAMVLADRVGIPIRYYRWEGAPPIIVARKPNEAGRTPQTIPTPDDRNIEKNPVTRGATWAVVAAGPNGLFGDEDIELIGQNLNLRFSTTDEVFKARLAAEADNVVEVGQ